MTETEKTNKEKIEALNELLNEELTAWEEMGVPDPNIVINFNPMQMSMWIKSLTKFLAEKGIIDEDEFIVSFKEHMLENLGDARQQVEPEVRKQRMKASGIELPGGNMAIPKGIIRKH